MFRNTMISLVTFESRESGKFAPVARVMELFVLEPGETLEQKAAELDRKGIGIAPLAEIRAWMESGGVRAYGSIAIADVSAAPRVSSSSPPIIQVPAHAQDGKGKTFYNGWIDWWVPAPTVEGGGMLAILGTVLRNTSPG